MALSAFVRTRCTTRRTHELAANETESFRSLLSLFFYESSDLYWKHSSKLFRLAFSLLFFFLFLERKSSSCEPAISCTLLSFYAFVFIESPRSVVFMSNDDDDPRTGRRPMITRVMRMSYRLPTPIPVSRGSDTSRPSVSRLRDARHLARALRCLFCALRA